MLTSLDFLILVVMALVAVSLVAMVLMFLIKNNKFRRVCLYLVAALGIYMGYVGLQLMWPNFAGRSLMAVLAALAAAASIVLERPSKRNANFSLLSRITASAALVTGLLNAFV